MAYRVIYCLLVLWTPFISTNASGQVVDTIFMSMGSMFANYSMVLPMERERCTGKPEMFIPVIGIKDCNTAVVP